MLIRMKWPKTGNLLPSVAGVNMETYRPSTWQPSQINTLEGEGRKSKGEEREGVRERGPGGQGGPISNEGTLWYSRYRYICILWDVL